MATVYYFQDDKDEKRNQIINAIGQSVSQVIGAYGQRKDANEAQDAMQRISATKSRQEALRVVSGLSPRLLRNEKLFGRVQNFLEAFQPGEQALQVYDKTSGRIKLMPYKSGTVPTQEEFDVNNARLEPFENYYAKVVKKPDPNNPTSLPYSIEPLGRLGSREEAQRRAFDFFPQDQLQTLTIMDEKEAKGERDDLKTAIDLAVKSRTATISEERNRIFRDRNQISQEAADYAKSKGKTKLGKLQEDYSSGLINKAQYQSAVKKELSDRSYKSAMDKVVIEKTDELVQKRIALEKMITTGNIFIDNVSKGGAQLGTVGAVVRGYDSIIAQTKAAYESAGWSSKPVDDYKWPTGLASASASTKSLALTLTMARLASEGQTGRSVTDRDLQLFKIDESGSPGQMLETMKTIINTGIANYYSEQNILADQYGLDKEDKFNAPFSYFGNAKQRKLYEENQKLLTKYRVQPGIGPGDKITIERKVQEALGNLPGLFNDDDEDEDE